MGCTADIRFLRGDRPVGHVADVETESGGVGQRLILCAQKEYFPRMNTEDVFNLKEDSFIVVVAVASATLKR